MHAFHERDDIVQSISEFAAAALVTAWTSADAFGEDMALGGGNMPCEIAQSEFLSGGTQRTRRIVRPRTCSK
jgi:hypothetical protein